jgi:HD-like signal output (HDOD) protein
MDGRDQQDSPTLTPRLEEHLPPISTIDLESDHSSASAQKKSDALGNTPWAHLRIPPFPMVAIRVMQLAEKENVQLHQFSELIGSDPAFAAEVLIIANSAFYAPRFPARSILQAIAVMGANHLQGICLTVAVRAYLGKSMGNPAIRNLWRHNLACGLIAAELAEAGFMDKDVAYTSGILHDIGRLALAAIRPKEYSGLLDSHQGDAESILEAERQLFGSDHCQVGRRLILDWKMPGDFETTVCEHHDPRREDGYWAMGELIKTSCKMADSAGFAAFPGCLTMPYEEVLKELPAREQKAFYPRLDALIADLTGKIRSLENL